MIKIALILAKSCLRRRNVIIWVFLFPIALLLLFGYMYSSGTVPRKPLYIYSSNIKLERALVHALNSTRIFDVHVLNRSVADPTKFVLDETSRLGQPVTLVVVGSDGVEIYSTSRIVGEMVRGYVEGALIQLLYPEARLPFNVTLSIPGAKNKSRLLSMMSTTRLAIMLALTQPLLEGLHVATLVDVLIITGLSKRIAMFRVTRYKTALAVTFASFIVAVLSTITLAVTAYIVFNVKLSYTLFSWSMWIAYILVFLFGAGIGLIMSRAALERNVESTVVSGIATSIFLILAFLSGYYIPLEVMPQDMLKIALMLPTTQLGIFAYTTTLGATPNLAALTYSAAISIITFTVGVVLFKPYKKI